MRVRQVTVKDRILLKERCQMPHPHRAGRGLPCGGVLSEWPRRVRPLAEDENAEAVITCPRCGARYVEVDR